MGSRLIVQSRCQLRTRLFVPLVISALITVGCTLLDPDYASVTRENSITKLVADSPGVRKLLNEAAEHDATVKRSLKERPAEKQDLLIQELQKPSAQRRQLLDAISGQTGVVVTGKQYFRELERSTAGCDIYPISSATYVRVRVSTGPSKGREGWACSRDVQPTGAWVM
jgi:hypothetical protein